MLAPPSAIDHDSLRIPTLSPERAEAAALRCRGATVDGSDVIVPWTQLNAEALAILGEQAVSPMLRDYTFPGPFKPMPHQIQICNEQVVNRRYFNLSQQGLGKTAMCIWTALYLQSIGQVTKVLVVGTVSGLVETWANSYFEISMQQANVITGSTRAAKMKRALNPVFFNCINFDGVVALEKELLKTKWDLIIVDESRHYGNPSTARWKALNKLVKPETRVVGLTGTPRSRSPLDVFGQCKLINPGNVPSSIYAFRNATMKQQGLYQWVEQPWANEICAKAMTPGRVLKKADVMQHLPPVTYSYVPVPLSAQQLAHYAELKKNKLFKGAEGGDVTAVNAAVLVGKLAQIASGCVYDENGTVQQFDCQGRVDAMMNLVEESLSGTIIFAPFKSTVAMLMGKLGPLGFRAITGETPLAERTEIIAGVQAGQIPGIVAVPSTISHGITLDQCSTIIWFAPVNSTETWLQANARCDRGAQKNAVSIYMLFGSSVERVIYQQRQGQSTSQQELLDMFNRVSIQ